MNFCSVWCVVTAAPTLCCNPFVLLLIVTRGLDLIPARTKLKVYYSVLLIFSSSSRSGFGVQLDAEMPSKEENLLWSCSCFLLVHWGHFTKTFFYNSFIFIVIFHIHLKTLRLSFTLVVGQYIQAAAFADVPSPPGCMSSAMAAD